MQRKDPTFPIASLTALAADAAGNTSEFAPARSLGETIFRDSYED